MRPEAALRILGDPRRVKVCKYCPYAARDGATILEHQIKRHGRAGATKPLLFRGWWKTPIYRDVAETRT